LDLVAVATIGKPSGLKGACALFPIGETLMNADLPMTLWVGNENGVRKITLCDMSGEMRNIRAIFDGISDRDEADGLKNLLLYLEKERLPKLEDDEFYFRDLTGLSVFDEYGEKLGVVKEVFNYPTTDAMDIRRNNGKVITVPFKKEIVKNVSLEDKKIVVDRVFIDELMY
jgi:16S rRNA processing protein RimM